MNFVRNTPQTTNDHQHDSKINFHDIDIILKKKYIEDEIKKQTKINS